MKHRERYQKVVRGLGYTLGILIILTSNLILPLMIILSPIISNIWYRFLLVLIILLLCESVIWVTLMKSTTRREAMRKTCRTRDQTQFQSDRREIDAHL